MSATETDAFGVYLGHLVKTQQADKDPLLVNAVVPHADSITFRGINSRGHQDSTVAWPSQDLIVNGKLFKRGAWPHQVPSVLKPQRYW